MKQHFSDEILSAYVDGELPSQERAEVERWLGDNAEARERLDEFRRMSGLFAGLARSELPREFPAKVLQLAERRMLLLEVADVAMGQRSSRRARGWVLAILAPVASAAVLVVMLQGYFRAPAEPLPPGAVAHDRPSDLSPALAADAGRTTPLDESQPAKTPVATSDRVPAGAPLEQIARTNPELVEVINRAIQDGQASGGVNQSVPVVRVYIADSSSQGMVLLQNVLIEHDVLSEREDGVDEQGRSAPGSKSEAAPPVQPGQEALFVIAEPEPLIAAFSEMLAREHPALRLTVEEPIEIAALDNQSQRRLQRLSEGLGPLADQAKSDGKPEFKTKAGGASEKKSLARLRPPADKAAVSAKSKDSPGPENAEKAKKEEKEAAAPAEVRLANGRSRQLVVPVPREIEQRGRIAGMKSQSKTTSETAGGEVRQLRRVANEPARDEKSNSDDTRDRPAQSMVRVLIVIEHEENTRPAAASPAAK